MCLPIKAQYQVKSFDISKNVTALYNSESGALNYGTVNGEFGLYDGILFNRLHSFNSKVGNIVKKEDGFVFLTAKGLYKQKSDGFELISRNNLDILASSEDNGFLATTNGVYTAINNEYHPDKEDFFNINEIEFGDFFKLGKHEIFRADNIVYIKNKRWRELLIHPEKNFSVLPWNSKQVLICDRKALISMDTEGYVDTLLHINSEEHNKIFKISNSKVLICSNDSIGIYDNRKNELNNFYSLNTELINCVAVDEWSNIWIAAGSYLFQIIDHKSKNRHNPPNVQIDKIKIDGIEMEISSSFKINKEENEVEIEYSGVQLTSPRNLEFETMLSARFHSLGYNNSDQGEWTKPSKSRSVEYRNLKSGKYTFQLRATIDGEYYTYTKPVVFIVESDLFQSIWLFSIIAGVFILVIALFFNRRYNLLKEKSKRDRQKLIQENKMLSLQQSALQLQMNPHFVFNALNSIQGLIAKNDNKNARKYLQEFSSMMRSVLNQSREENILLSDEIKYLKSYLNLEQMANNKMFDWEIEVHPNIEDNVKIPTMIIQPFVENAIIHGVKSLKERRGEIKVAFAQSRSTIICKVRDNGIGRLAANQLRNRNHKSVALDVVNERLSTKFTSSRANPIQYNDIQDENKNALGTEVIILIPIMN